MEKGLQNLNHFARNQNGGDSRSRIAKGSSVSCRIPDPNLAEETMLPELIRGFLVHIGRLSERGSSQGAKPILREVLGQ